MSEEAKIQLKPLYETGELIVVAETAARKFSPSSELLLFGPNQSTRPSLRIPVQRGPGNTKYFEFYALTPGAYRLLSQWGSSEFEVRERQGLGFHMEFGIFSAVVGVLVLGMAWRYLVRPKFKKGKL